MEEKVIQSLSAVLASLNLVSVCGKNNLANLCGSIQVIEQTIEEIKRSVEAEKE